MSCRVSPFWFLFFFISIVVPAPFKEVLSSSTTSSVTKSMTQECYRENYNFIKYEYGESFADFQFATVDEEVSFECNPYGEKFIEQHKQHQEEFLVYPTSTRKCLPSGIWDGIPPLCAWASQNISANETIFTVVPRKEACDCKNSSICVKARKEWTSIGQKHERYPVPTDYSFDTKKQIITEALFIFHQHIHLSFMTFNLDSAEDASFYVDVRVPPHNVIRELSNLSSSLLQKHGELWLREMANLTRQCAVTGIAAYTDRVVVSFSKAADALQESKNNEWIPKPVFYAVPRFNNTSVNIIDNEEMLCPKRPTKFPNAIIENEDSDGSSFTIVCSPGYSIRDPETNERFDRREITCRKKLEWFPYPFPVCSPQRENNDGKIGVDSFYVNISKLILRRTVANLKEQMLNFETELLNMLNLMGLGGEESTSNNVKREINPMNSNHVIRNSSEASNSCSPIPIIQQPSHLYYIEVMLAVIALLLLFCSVLLCIMVYRLKLSSPRRFSESKPPFANPTDRNGEESSSEENFLHPTPANHNHQTNKKEKKP